MSEIKSAVEELRREPQTVIQWFESLEVEDQHYLTNVIQSKEVSVAQLHRTLQSLDTNPLVFGLTAFKDFARAVRDE